jgi:hypothetical protein
MVIGTTRPTGSAAIMVIGATRPAAVAVVTLLLGRWPAGPTAARAAGAALALTLARDVRAARRTARLGGGKSDACGERGESNAEGNG